MAKIQIGLKQLLMGDVAIDGGMGTALTQLGATVVDTAVLTNEAPTVTDFTIEEQDDPYYTNSVAGKRTLSWSTYDLDPASLVRICGGAASTDASGNDVWEAPLDTPQIEVSIKLIDQKNNIVEIPRAKLDVILERKFQKSGIAQANITATILKPEKANTAPYRVISPNP